MSEQPKQGDTILQVVDGDLVEMEVLESNGNDLILQPLSIECGFTKPKENCKHDSGVFPDSIASVIFLRCNDCGKIQNHILKNQLTPSPQASNEAR